MTAINSVLSTQDLVDGNVFVPDLLAALGEETGPALPLAQGTPRSSLPVGLFRLRTATPAVRSAAHGWLQNGDTHDERLLHEAETSMLLRPPVHERARAADEELVGLFLGVARSWLAVAAREQDPRYLNAALKLIACAILSDRAAGRGQAAREAVAAAHDGLARIAAAIPPTMPPASQAEPNGLQPKGRETESSRIVVLAGEGSRGLPLFLDTARRSGFTVHGVLHHAPAPGGVPAGSEYAAAWYPETRSAARVRALPDIPATLPQRHLAHGDWIAAAEQLAQWNSGLLVLLGMDVVPSQVLDVPSAGTINAHNGELPAFRGMDAVAWARLAGRHPVCSVHRVTPAVDAGEVLASAVVPADSADLRAAVKTSQIALLARTAADYAVTGTLSAGRRQDQTAARRWYRMHPALRRLLDRHYTDPTLSTTASEESSI
ncbi:formyltransferase family protein [Streptomyces europaeiscabiei]|uniref:formyltransferase family protein n=1 Tax=Streptomyces europaeiscabiei TaxID=146819 RepID=UPI002E183010